MDITKLLEDSDPLIAATELNEKLPEKVQNVFIMAAQSLDQRKNAGNIESGEMSSYVLSHLLWSSILKHVYCTFK